MTRSRLTGDKCRLQSQPTSAVVDAAAAPQLAAAAADAAFAALLLSSSSRDDNLSTFCRRLRKNSPGDTSVLEGPMLPRS